MQNSSWANNSPRSLAAKAARIGKGSHMGMGMGQMSSMTRTEGISVGGVAKGTGRSLLLQQAEEGLITSLNELREYNAELLLEIADYKNELALSAEQANLLKDNIRELQGIIDREREFNASTRRLNADYLVNVLHKFLLSDLPAEKGGCLPVCFCLPVCLVCRIYYMSC